MELQAENNLEWTCYHSLEEATPIWRSLMNVGNYRVFQDPDWTKAWLRTAGKHCNVSPRIIVGTYEQQPVILLPLGVYKSRGIRRLAWLGSDWNDYNVPVVGDQTLLRSCQNVWAKVFELVGRVDFLEISKQASYFTGNTLNALALRVNTLEDNNTHILDLQSDQKALRDSIYSNKTWKGFDRKRKKLEKLGDVTFHEETCRSQRKLIVDEMLRAKAIDLEASGKNNPFSGSGNSQFLPYLAENCDEIVRLFTLRLNGEIIATTLCLAEKESLMLYQTGYEKRFSYASPGTLLLHDIIFKAADEGYKTFDCLFGDEPYKLKICNRSVPVGRVIVPLSKVGRVMKLLIIGKIVLNRKIKKSPQMYSFARKINQLLSGIKFFTRVQHG